ncbi:Aerotaxis receptor [Vibrio stylophorae]|uniref:Aerotaxis receptor n=1 Tax=Vibrio stylophorae TaxID=659351 RepID=A0ABN8DQX2_9VIBR|nr:PAS domain-containing methyl-accepting chemotaxis protein [Vibrio stylophorae]CAH0533135.1 Aerotaxis receptor [Vibrio stylophorae]
MNQKKPNTSDQHQKEKLYADTANLISTTDPKSIVTYANQVFCDVAEYQAEELQGQPHNVVRHPDMPKAAFAQLWSYIQGGKSWMGLVKNKCKSGKQHYWVSAFVTPIMGPDGKVLEYQSVRSQPTREQKQRAQSLYQKINQGKAKQTPRIAFHLIGIGFSALSTLAALIATFAQDLGIWGVGLSALCGVTLVSQWLQWRRFQNIRTLAKAAYSNPLMEYPYTGAFDSYSEIELALLMRKAELRAVAGRTSDTSGQILQSAEEEFATLQQIDQSLNQQCHETEQVAAAVEELTHSIGEVANSATAASMVTQDAHLESQQGRDCIEATMAAVDELTLSLSDSQQIIHQLSQDSQKIELILDVITTISEQTNLLALNAAIEAARAGEAGRGFAVVAGEVRNLATKTGESANEIQTLITSLQKTAEQAVVAMSQGGELSQQCKMRADETGQVLTQITDKLNQVTDSSQQIAAAVEQQATVTQDINRNINNIKLFADETAVTSQSSIERTRGLVARIEDLQRLIRQFSAER